MHNILYLSDTGAIVGGGEVSLVDLVSVLDRNRYRPFFVVSGDGQLAKKIRDMDMPVNIIHWKAIKNPFNFFSVIRNLNIIKEIIFKEKIDVVHCNASGGLTVLSALAARKNKVPFVWHVRTDKPARLLDLINASLSTVVVVVSQAVAERFNGICKRSKIVKIHNGVDISRFTSVAVKSNLRAEIGCPQDAILITAVGRFHPIKGYTYLIKAALRVTRIVDKSFFLIVGMDEKEYGYYLRRLIKYVKKMGLDNKVKFIFARNDIPDILVQSDIFVMPSLYEAFGRSLVEAMACEKPVIAFESGGPKEIIKDGITGILVEPRNVKILAEKICLLINDRGLRQKIALNAREDVRNRFSIEKHVQDIQNLYKDLCTNMSGRHD